MAGAKLAIDQTDFRIGLTLAMMRCRLGLTQKDVAAAIGVSHQQYQKYESGKTRLSVGGLIKIAQHFEMTVGELIDGMPPRHITDPDIYKMADMMCRMDAKQRKMVLQFAESVVARSPSATEK